MKTNLVLAWAALSCLSVWGCASAPTSPRVVTELNGGWTLSVNNGPAKPVTVPNDWSIAGPFARTNPTSGGGGFAPSGIATYTRPLDIPPSAKGKYVSLEFDGVMAHSEVYVNDKKLGGRPNGYVSFTVDLTDAINWSGPNILRVTADTSKQPASRWYAGAGIYRPARMVVTEPLRWIKDGMSSGIVTRNNEVTFWLEAEAIAQNARASISVFDPAGRKVGAEGMAVFKIGDLYPLDQSQQLDGSGTNTVTFKGLVKIPDAIRWDIGQGALYTARVELAGKSGIVTDSVSIPFGIRDTRFEPATGFWINGRNVKLKGVCLHGDGGAVGTAVPTQIWEQRLRALRDIGVNAIRTAHNPPDPAFLDLCDRMGFVVMDELFDCWRVGKNRNDYHLDFDEWSKQDVADTVRRDRNHPSVILWSAGNEIHDTPNAAAAKEILKGLVETFHANDPTRPVTQALFRPNASHDYDDGLADMLDVVGQNYRERELQAAADQKPTRKIIGTENQHGRAIWLALRDDPRMAGQFLWTGIDYLGESHAWPAIGAASGLLDRTGAMKPLAYECQSWWSDKPMVYACRRVAPNARAETDPGYGNGPVTATNPRETLFEDWTPTNPNPHEETVEVYSNCKSVELILNGKSQGTQGLHPDASPRTWKVLFEPGTLQAVTDKGNTFTLRTAGQPAALKLFSDHKAVGSDFNSAALLRAIVVDANGTRVPTSTAQVTFTVSETGQLIGVDNGDPRFADSFQGPTLHALRGKCAAIVRAQPNTTDFTVTARAEGLPPATWHLATLSLRPK